MSLARRGLHRGLIPLLLAALLSMTATISRAAEPYALRGIRLGILLADFKILPHPDRDSAPEARPFCSDDPAAGAAIPVSKVESKVGIVRCAYFHEGSSPPAPAGLIVVGAKADMTFVFVPDSTGALRLAWMRAATGSDHYASIRAALLKKYGQPKSKMQGFVHDAAGTKLVDETLYWSNGASDIRLDQRDEGADILVMSIEYSHEALAAEGLKRLKAVAGEGVDSL